MLWLLCLGLSVRTRSKYGSMAGRTAGTHSEAEGGEYRMKKVYSAPLITDLGDMRQITQQSGKGFVDAVIGVSANNDGTVTASVTSGSKGCPLPAAG